jgi:hypothetical protein
LSIVAELVEMTVDVAVPPPESVDNNAAIDPMSVSVSSVETFRDRSRHGG